MPLNFSGRVTMCGYVGCVGCVTVRALSLAGNIPTPNFQFCKMYVISGMCQRIIKKSKGEGQQKKREKEFPVRESNPDLVGTRLFARESDIY